MSGRPGTSERPGSAGHAGRLGFPRLHFRRTDSTSTRARELAVAGATHGMLVTADVQDAGRGRQGRTWSAPPRRALLCSLVLREPARLLALAAAVAVAETVEALRTPGPTGRGADAPVRIKWPNDVQLERRKVAGILVEGRPQERWAVLGIGLNVAVALDDLPPQLRRTAATLGLEPAAVEAALPRLLDALERWLTAPERTVLDAFRGRDATLGEPVRWDGGEGVGAGVDDVGRLRVRRADGSEIALDAGEVHLGAPPRHGRCE